MNAEKAFIEAIAEAVADKLQCFQQPTVTLEDLGIQPLQVYSVKATAELLDCSEAAIRSIPEAELPKARRAGTGIGYLGINIMLYAQQLPPIDMTEVLERYRNYILNEWLTDV